MLLSLNTVRDFGTKFTNRQKRRREEKGQQRGVWNREKLGTYTVKKRLENYFKHLKKEIAEECIES